MPTCIDRRIMLSILYNSGVMKLAKVQSCLVEIVCSSSEFYCMPINQIVFFVLKIWVLTNNMLHFHFTNGLQGS